MHMIPDESAQHGAAVTRADVAAAAAAAAAAGSLGQGGSEGENEDEDGPIEDVKDWHGIDEDQEES